jgi:hypothetical protein
MLVFVCSHCVFNRVMTTLPRARSKVPASASTRAATSAAKREATAATDRSDRDTTKRTEEPHEQAATQEMHQENK